MRKKGLITLAAIIFFTLILQAFLLVMQQEDGFPPSLEGIPVYPASRYNDFLSSQGGNPRVYVFLSDDTAASIVAFYEDFFAVQARKLTYPSGLLRIYQFMITPSIVKDTPLKGVEVIPLNRFNRRIFKALTKIKIILPPLEEEKTERTAITD